MAGIDPESVSDGPGVRFTIFFSGCKHRCPGCQNPDAQDFGAGVDFDDPMQAKVIEHIARCPIISGVTLSGGDPMFSAGDVLRFVRHLREKLPAVNCSVNCRSQSFTRARFARLPSIWLYTGFTYEELSGMEQKDLLELCDVLVDGRFEQDNLDLSLSYRGSTNQRIIDLAETRATMEISLLGG